MVYSIIVPVHEGESFYRSFAESYIKSGLNENESTELIFVLNRNERYNNALSDILKSYNIVFKLFEYNDVASSYAARNYAAKFANGEFLIFVDIDIVWPETYSIALNNLILRDDCVYAGRVDMFVPHRIERFIDRMAARIDQLLFLNTVRLSKLKLGVTAHAIIPAKIHNRYKFRVVESGGDIDFFRRVTMHFNYQYLESVFVKHPVRSHDDLLIKIHRVAGGLQRKNLRNCFKNLVLLMVPVWNIKYFFKLGLAGHFYIFILHIKYRSWLLKL